MKKLLLAVLLHVIFLSNTKAQTKYFNQWVDIRSCNITVKANRFIATTFIEMEFYNSRDSVVEGYRNISLGKGQVVSGFQLELNGKYREGSIEERWKARAAYSTIVGKRIDPALLQMEYDNDYSIHVYPVPAHGSRKVTMTIDQLLTEDSNTLNYVFPLSFTSPTGSFHLNIEVTDNESLPVCNKGLLKGYEFTSAGLRSSLYLSMENVVLGKPISFSIPKMNSKPQVCISKEGNHGKFLVYYAPAALQYYEVKPKEICVFWDVSSSAGSRDIKKELDFLEAYIAKNNIKTTTVTLFNHAIQGSYYIQSNTDNFKRLRNYLLNYNYSGATCFGNLDLSATRADAILIFSDGYNSFGKATPKPSMVQVNCIVSTTYPNRQQLLDIIATTGGSLISIYKTEVADAVKKIENARNFLMKYNSVKGTVRINEGFPIALGQNILLSGTFESEDDLQFIFGNNGAVNKIENIHLSVMDTCQDALYKKVKMLKSYDSLANGWNWQEMIIFGLTEKVMTRQTSFLVLERIEDYIKYNIAPPKELEAECAERNYVYKNEYKIRALKTFTEQDALQTTVNTYNRYLKWWDTNEPAIDLSKKIPVAETEGNTVAANSKTPGSITESIANNTGGNQSNTIKEVIVTSAFNTKRTLRSQSSNVQNVSAEQLNTVRGYDLNNAIAGKVAGLQVLSQSAVALGRESHIRLRGENGLGVGNGPAYVVNGAIVPSVFDINPDDIQYVTVLQGPAAAALFGSDGANGAIVITTKRASRYYYPKWSDFKLKNIADVDYIDEIKTYADEDLSNGYTTLEKINKGHIGFYFDMADYFFEKKLKEKGLKILFEGIELCRGDSRGLKAAAFVLEEWKYFDEAIGIYQDLADKSPRNMMAKRDLALAFFQNGEYQKAVNTYYQVINNSEDGYYYDDGIRTVAMNEMNAIISLHKNVLDLSEINFNLIKQLPLDLRITVENNYEYMNNVRIKDEDDKEFSSSGIYSKAGYVSGSYWNYNNLKEVSVKNAVKGTYKIKVDSYNSTSYAGKMPVVLRLVIFKNFQKENQTMEVQHIVMDNQYGSVEVAEVKW